MRGSIYLRRALLAAVGLLFTLFIVTLEILNYISNRDQGFVSADRGKQYIWMYGPVFVLSIVSAFWGQLQYRVRQSTPWVELTRKPRPASKNILLNYLTPWSVISLFRSLRAGHLPVFLVILGGFTFKVLIVFSTGLLSLENKRLTYQTEFLVVDQFNFSMMGFETRLTPVDPGVAVWAMGQRNGSYLPGTTSDSAALFFSPLKADLSASTNLSAIVPVFNSDLECTDFSWTYDSQSHNLKDASFSLADIMSATDLEILSPFCPVGVGNMSWDPHPSLTNNKSSSWLNNTIVVDTTCPNNFGDFPPGHNTARIFTSVVIDSPNNISTVSALLCHPTYLVSQRRVTTSLERQLLDISTADIEAMDLGIEPSLLTNEIIGEALFFVLLGDERNIWLKLMEFTTGKSDMARFANATELSRAFKQTFKTVAALTAKYTKSMPAPAEQTVEGTIDTDEARLVVTQLALRVMESLFGLLILMVILLGLFDFGPVAQYIPSLTDMAVIFSKSDLLASALSRLRVASLEAIMKDLHGYLFSAPQDLSSIQTQDDLTFIDTDSLLEDSEKETLTGSPNNHKWWLPTAATTTFRVSAIVVTLLLFAALEALYQVSAKNSGIAEVPEEGNVRYVWMFLPTAAVAGLGLTYVAMDNATRTLHPFVQLARKKANARGSINFNPHSNIGLVALAKALHRKAFGLSMIILASILSSILTIAASGLYSTTPGHRTESITLKPSTWFDIMGVDRSAGGRLESTPDVLMSQGIQYYNLSYPAGTHGEFAFGLPDAKHLVSSGTTAPRELTAQVPAIRGRLNCSLHEFQDVIRNAVGDNGHIVETTPPPGCTKGPNDDLSPGTKIVLTQNAGQAPKQGYYGFVSSLSWNLYHGPSEQRTYTPDNRTPYTVCNDSTQHIFLVYGNRVNNDAHNHTVLHCLPYIEALLVEATFTLPNLTIDALSPLSSAILESITPWNFKNRALNSIPLPDLTLGSWRFGLDDFFTAVAIGGRHATPMADLVGRGNVERMVKRVEEVAGELWAQSLHFNYRSAVVPGVGDATTAVGGRGVRAKGGGFFRVENDGAGRPIPSKPISGTLIIPLPPGRARLVQSAVSTRVLEGLLLAMAVFAGLSFWLTGRMRVVPVDVGSIAAVMSLFAGSELVERMKEAGEGGKVVVDGEKLRIGWWDGAEQDGSRGNGVKVRRYGIDVVVSQG